MSDDRGIGDNGGPSIQKFTARQKLEHITRVLEMDITAAQKCVGIGIIVEADTDWITPELSTERLRQFANVKDRETVYKATKKLSEHDVVRAQKVEGKANRYVVLPASVVDAIVEAYNTAKTSQAEPDGACSGVAVGSGPTTPVEPVGSDRTGTAKTDAPHALAPARLEPPSGVVITNIKQPTTTVETETARDVGVDLDALNGSAVDLIAFISKYASVDLKNAERMLATNIRAFSADAMLEAHSVTMAEMATGGVASPYKYLMKVAMGAKERARSAPKRGADKSEKGESRSERLERVFAKVEAEKIGKRQ